LTLVVALFVPQYVYHCTDKKEKIIFRMYKEIQMGAVAKSHVRKGFLIYEKMCRYLVICIRKPLVIYDFATDPFWISLCI
jgi:hypothetical protein